MSGYVKVPGLDAVRDALDEDVGHGFEMLPIGTSQEIIKRIFDKSWARKTFTAMPMSESVVNIPKITAGITVQGTTGQADFEADESRHTTTDITLSIVTIIANAPISNKLQAYAVLSMMPIIKDDIVNTFLQTEEDMFVNGDATTTTAYADNINGAYHATNYPNGIVGARDPRLEFDGLRKIALDGSCVVNASGANLSQTHILEAFACMGIYASDPADLVIIVSHSVKALILGWDDLTTVADLGPKATIITGQIGELFGAKVIASTRIPENLGTDGRARSQASGTTGNRTVVLIVNKRSPIIGNPTKTERKFRIVVDPEPQKDRIVLVPKEDLAFGNRWEEAVCHIINIAPGCL